MIIVSQDKEKIINFDNIQGIRIVNSNVLRVIFVGTENDYLDAGKYETEEKAKQILKEIINFYEISERTKATRLNDKLLFSDKFVYEMP